jgi:hypothetical protein
MDINVVLALIGVGGTLLGTILGWLLNSFSSLGKLNIFVTLWEETFQYNNDGHMENSNSKEQTEHYWYELKLDLYNSSAEIKVMRDIKIEFLNGKNVSVVQIPYDYATKVFHQHFYSYSDVEAINISPKSVLQYKLCNGYNKEKLDGIWKSTKAMLSYVDEKNKKRTVFIASLKHDAYFSEKNGA